MWYFGPQNMGRPALSNRKKCQLGMILGGAPDFEWIVDRLRLAETAVNRT